MAFDMQAIEAELLDELSEIRDAVISEERDASFSEGMEFFQTMLGNLQTVYLDGGEVLDAIVQLKKRAIDFTLALDVGGEETDAVYSLMDRIAAFEYAVRSEQDLEGSELSI